MAKETEKPKEDEKEEKKDHKPIKTITLGVVLCWLISIFLLIVSYENFIRGMYVPGILVLLPALAILPLTNILLRKYLHVELSQGLRTTIVIVCIAFLVYIAYLGPLLEVPPRESGITDENGLVMLDIGNATLTFTLKDQVSGIPLEGMEVAVGFDPAEPWHSLLLIRDPSGQYPLKLVGLNGAAGGAGPAQVMKPSISQGLVGAFYADTSPIDILYGRDEYWFLREPMDEKYTPYLPDSTNLPPHVDDLTKMLPDALQKLTKATGVRVTSQRVDATDMPKQIVEDYTDAMSYENIPGWVIGMVKGGSAVPGMLGEFTNGLSEIAFTNMGATEYDIVEVNAGPINFKVYKPIFPEGTGPIFPPSPESTTVDVSGETGPVSGGYIEMMSKTTMGDGFVALIGKDGTALIPLPIGDYSARILTPGNEPKRLDIPIKSTGGKIPVTVLARKPITIELFTQPVLASRANLPQGTTRKIAMIVRDAKGKELTAKEKAALRCTYFVRNPLGKSVAIVSRDGTITMGADSGAASVVARCNGVLSKPMLISGSGEKPKDKPPVQPDNPDVPDQPSNLPPGFPTNLPTGDYQLAVKVCITVAGCIQQSGGLMHNSDPAEFANQITDAMNQWMGAMNQGQCRASVTYSPFDGRSFSSNGVGYCQQGNQRANVQIQFVLTKV